MSELASSYSLYWALLVEVYEFSFRGTDILSDIICRKRKKIYTFVPRQRHRWYFVICKIKKGVCLGHFQNDGGELCHLKNSKHYFYFSNLPFQFRLLNPISISGGKCKRTTDVSTSARTYKYLCSFFSFLTESVLMCTHWF